jgi:hypothetical protein
MKAADEQYKQGFFDELHAFRERVKTRAKQKIEDAVKQYEEVDLFKKKKFIKHKIFLGRATKTPRSRWFRSNRSYGIITKGKNNE